MWKEEKNKLKKIFQFQDFDGAFAFMAEAAKIFKSLNHHPFWCNSYNKVSLELSTHEEGNVVTQKDREAAKMLDSLYETAIKKKAS